MHDATLADELLDRLVRHLRRGPRPGPRRVTRPRTCATSSRSSAASPGPARARPHGARRPARSRPRTTCARWPLACWALRRSASTSTSPATGCARHVRGARAGLPGHRPHPDHHEVLVGHGRPAGHPGRRRPGPPASRSWSPRWTRGPPTTTCGWSARRSCTSCTTATATDTDRLFGYCTRQAGPPGLLRPQGDRLGAAAVRPHRPGRGPGLRRRPPRPAVPAVGPRGHQAPIALAPSAHGSAITAPIFLQPQPEPRTPNVITAPAHLDIWWASSFGLHGLVALLGSPRRTRSSRVSASAHGSCGSAPSRHIPGSDLRRGAKREVAAVRQPQHFLTRSPVKVSGAGTSFWPYRNLVLAPLTPRNSLPAATCGRGSGCGASGLGGSARRKPQRSTARRLPSILEWWWGFALDAAFVGTTRPRSRCQGQLGQAVGLAGWADRPSRALASHTPPGLRDR